MAKHFMNMADQFINQFGGAPNQEETKEGQATEENPHCQWKNWKKDSKWNEKRAVVKITEDVLEGEPGQVIIANVEVENQTKWPWKRGCYLGQTESAVFCPIKVEDIPIDFEVRGLQTFKLSIPINIPKEIKKGDNDTYDVVLAFYGPKGTTFGHYINLKVKVTDNASEENLYRTAINLTEAGLGSFDDCVEALKKCNCDENAAC
jgi:hypothetical protein